MCVPPPKTFIKGWADVTQGQFFLCILPEGALSVSWILWQNTVLILWDILSNFIIFHLIFKSWSYFSPFSFCHHSHVTKGSNHHDAMIMFMQMTLKFMSITWSSFNVTPTGKPRSVFFHVICEQYVWLIISKLNSKFVISHLKASVSISMLSLSASDNSTHSDNISQSFGN